jgi:hypothetical protein
MLTRLAIATAPVLFVLLWSTGFIGARYGLPYIEPDRVRTIFRSYLRLGSLGPLMADLHQQCIVLALATGHSNVSRSGPVSPRNGMT